jgi:YHS domain-containing protein
MKKRSFLRVLPILLSSLVLTACASSGLVFEKEGVALRGYDPVAYFTQGQPVKGVPQFQAQHQGAVFHFASQASRDAFAAAPEKYAPQYGGYCAFGMASGYKAATDPTAFTINDNKLYLNYNREVQKMWSADAAGFINKADQNWPTASKQSKVQE